MFLPSAPLRLQALEAAGGEQLYHYRSGHAAPGTQPRLIPISHFPIPDSLLPQAALRRGEGTVE